MLSISLVRKGHTLGLPLSSPPERKPYFDARKYAWLRRSPTLSLTHWQLVQVASGVEYLHTLKPAIIHGDIKPSNVVIGDSGQALLCDFGLSRLSEGSTGYTSTIGAGVGTIGYRAPELTKPGQQSMEADIYALASVIIHVRLLRNRTSLQN